MNMSILFLLLLCIFLVVCLGINYSNIFTQTVSDNKSYTPTPISKTKYNSTYGYSLDSYASVFSNTVEPMANDVNCLSTRYGCCADGVNPKDANGNCITPAPTTTLASDTTLTDTTLTDTTTLPPLTTASVNCLSTRYGCCPDGITAKSDSAGTNCITPAPVNPVNPINCLSSRFGCCPDGITTKSDSTGANCLTPAPVNPVDPNINCLATRYGCCPNGVTAKLDDLGSNCPAPTTTTPAPPTTTPTPTTTTPAPTTTTPAPTTTTPAPTTTPSVTTATPTTTPSATTPAYCTTTIYGCCNDGITVKNKAGNNCVPPEPSDPVGGCEGSQYGCCADEVTFSNAMGTNCMDPSKVSCSEWPYGCCGDRNVKKNKDGSNCPENKSSCKGSRYGCCVDGVTSSNSSGNNCVWQEENQNITSSFNIFKFIGDKISGYAATGPNNSGYIIKGPNGNIYTGTTKNCNISKYGCCPDGVNSKDSKGNCLVNNWKLSGPNSNFIIEEPNGNILYKSGSDCKSSPYGCCPDNMTPKNEEGSNCSIYPPPPPQLNTNTVFIPPPTNYAYKNHTHKPYKHMYKEKEKEKIPEDNVSKSDYISTLMPIDPVPSTTLSCPTPAPCPPCGRCPEPSFECKKVPNYASTNSEHLPMPVLSDFSQFGM